MADDATRTTLVIQHLATEEGDRFQLVRPTPHRSTEPVEVASPGVFPVVGRPNSNLMDELRWYLEDFLGYPFPPETEHAERVQDALKAWGAAAFDALFDGRQAGRMFDRATSGDYANLQLIVSSDDPVVLSWPWEALWDEEVGAALAHSCRIERRLNGQREPAPLADDLPSDRINILLVTCRPYEGDVRYRSISRPLVELIRKQKLPAEVHVLRPPTFEQLEKDLRQRPNYYHVLHFDGHGAYADGAGGAQHHSMQGRQGRLIFEDTDGNPHELTAEQLGALLREHRLPAVVLNACQSAMLDADATGAFASVATSLLRAGVRSVTAMAYSLYVSAAVEFIPAFYGRLFEKGDFAEACRDGRRRLLARPDRVCARGAFPLADWLTPVLYQQDEPLSFHFLGDGAKADEIEWPEELRETQTPHGFIGRDGPLLQLERALHRAPAGVLIHGLGGVGKTTLARGFARWLVETDGVDPQRVFWFRFDEGIRNAEFVLNRIGERFYGPNFAAADLEQRLAALAKALAEHRSLIVWDNFEVVCGALDSQAGTLSQDDRNLLSRFLASLHGGLSKVLITSRSDEAWLPTEDRRRINLPGLDGEERWEYCAAILGDLGVKADRDDANLAMLIDRLAGHPLAMRVLLPKLETHSAASLLSQLETNFDSLAATISDDDERGLFATLLFAEQAIPADLRELLEPLALHERYLQVEPLEAMASQVDPAWTRDRLDRFLAALAAAGLLREVSQNVHELHPLLTRFLRSRLVPTEPWRRAFVDTLGCFANQLAALPLHEEGVPLHVHQENLRTALDHAEQLTMQTDVCILLQRLAVHANTTRDFPVATQLLKRLVGYCGAAGTAELEAAAYHQLGMVAQKQRDFTAAKAWYRKALAIVEKNGNESVVACCWQQLGAVALAQRDFASAQTWYHKALAICKEQGNEHGAAISCHQLGRVARERRDFAAAETWYRKSLAIKEKQGNEHGASTSYHELGMVAQGQRDFAEAEAWYRKSLAIEEKQGDEHGAARCYNQLGTVAFEQRDFTAAEAWYRKSLAIAEKQGDEHGAAITYHQVGMVAQSQCDFPAAKAWYRKSLAITERQGNEYGVAISCHQLGIVAREQRDFATAEVLHRKSLAVKEEQGNEHGAATSYHELGRVAEDRGQQVEALAWYLKALPVFREVGDPHNAGIALQSVLRNHQAATAEEQTRIRQMWQDAGLGDFPDADTLPPNQ